MENKYGFFGEDLGTYTITNLPKVGSYEYIYKNADLLLKVDQFGVQTAQINPPVGEVLLKREKREASSPVKLYFDFGEGIFHNFDVFHAGELCIEFTPEKATYSLGFGKISVKTEVFISAEGQRFIMKVSFLNKDIKPCNIRVMPCVYPYVNALMMAPWDKPEWYTKTEYKPGMNPIFQTTRYSVNGNKDERRYFTCVCNRSFTSFELSSERLIADTKHFSFIPESFTGNTERVLYAFEQCFAGIDTFEIQAGKEIGLTFCFACEEKETNLDEAIGESLDFLKEGRIEKEILRLKEKHTRLFNKRNVRTPDESFNRFINGFLPLEMEWVTALDRGWPTGMRGVRDAANDFQGFLGYDPQLCRDVIANIFSKQRSDGWYPRQVPFGNGDKFDLRGFVDSACFFTEFVYDYLAYTDDYSILDAVFPYYDCDKTDSGLAHLIAGIDYLMQPENIGEHGLIKMRGGDWLDCLSGAGLNGRGESVMVSCQMVMCIGYLREICKKIGVHINEKYAAFAVNLEQSINTYAWNGEGFYNGVFTDAGEWIFSSKDPDGERRIYAPTNAYAIISGVAKGKEKLLTQRLQELYGEHGYRLFSVPFGVKPIRSIGKMGTGDFQPYFAENGSVYNHGSQCFVLRALAAVGDYDAFEDVLGYALPMDETRHNPDALCGAPYAITNCYHLVPSFYGRMGFSFLTGSVAMLERAVYSWMFGVEFSLDEMKIKPCLPKHYANSQIKILYHNTEITIDYLGYGSNVVSAMIDGQTIACEQGVKLSKSFIIAEKAVHLTIKLSENV